MRNCPVEHDPFGSFWHINIGEKKSLGGGWKGLKETRKTLHVAKSTWEKKSQEMRQALLMQWPMRRTACKLFVWRPSETMWNLSKNAVKLPSIFTAAWQKPCTQRSPKRLRPGPKLGETLRDAWNRGIEGRVSRGVTVSRLATIRICTAIAACLGFPGLQFVRIKSATLHKKWVPSNCRGCPLSQEIHRIRKQDPSERPGRSARSSGATWKKGKEWFHV